MTASRIALLALGALVGSACSRAVIREPGPMPPQAPAAEIVTTLFLIGDAGAPHDDEPVLAALEQAVRAAGPSRYIVVLGDNIYPRGLPDTGSVGREEAERRIDAQIAVALRTETKTYFVPGNHDWDYMGPEGWEFIRRQGDYIERHGRPFAVQIPAGGCPGPAGVDLGDRVRLVALDTQWWLHDFEKPRDSTSACRFYDVRGVAIGLDRMLGTAGTRHVIVAGHHPLISGGEHGGHLGLEAHFFPLRTIVDWGWVPMPILGSSYAFNRAQGASNQDVRGPENVRMRRVLNWVFTRRKPLIYAAGHEHSLQVFRGRTAQTLLVSGTGVAGHVSHVHTLPNTRFAVAQGGFMRLDVLRDGRVRLGVIVVQDDGVAAEAWADLLRDES